MKLEDYEIELGAIPEGALLVFRPREEIPLENIKRFVEVLHRLGKQAKIQCTMVPHYIDVFIADGEKLRSAFEKNAQNEEI